MCSNLARRPSVARSKTAAVAHSTTPSTTHLRTSTPRPLLMLNLLEPRIAIDAGAGRQLRAHDPCPTEERRDGGNHRLRFPLMAVRSRDAKKGSPTRTGRGHEELGLSLDDVERMYRLMLLMRLISERMMQLNRMGKAAFTAASDGHEAAEVGAAWAIRRGHDWCVPYYRDLGVAIVLGLTALDEFRGVFAKATDPFSGGRQIINMFSSRKDRVLTGSVCIATQFPHAVGLALAARNRKED